MLILVCVVIGGTKVALGVTLPVWLWNVAWRAVWARKRLGRAETGMGVGVGVVAIPEAGVEVGTTGVTRPRRAKAVLGVGFVAEVLPPDSWFVKGRWAERVLNGVLAWK